MNSHSSRSFREISTDHWGQAPSFSFISYLSSPSFLLSFIFLFFLFFFLHFRGKANSRRKIQKIDTQDSHEGCETKVRARRTHHFPSRSLQQDGGMAEAFYREIDFAKPRAS